MKKILNVLIVFSLVFFYSCDPKNSDYDIDNATTGVSGGAIVAISANSDGKLLGAPSSSDLSTATVAFSSNSLTLEVILMSGGQDVTGYELTKSINGGAEVTAASSATLPISLTYSTIDEYISGLGTSVDDLRIGDVITFRTKIIKSDGSVYFAGPNEGNFNVTINCSADLTGTYSVSNTGCSLPMPDVTITANADGTWHLTRADGGFLSSCTTNSTLFNFGNITVVCGAVLPTGDLDFGSDNSSYDIGDISGGSWDAVTGTLTMEHSQTFTTNWPAEWTSTYVRQ